MFWHRHTHRWKVSAVHQLFEINMYMRDVKKPVTEVLAVCDCGTVRTFNLTGHWTVEQLQPPLPTAREIDREFLRRMGVKS